MNLLHFKIQTRTLLRLMGILILSAVITGILGCSDDPEMPPPTATSPQKVTAESDTTKIIEVIPTPADTSKTSVATTTAIPSPTPANSPTPEPISAITEAIPTATYTATPEPQESRFDQFRFSIVVEDKGSTVLTSLLEETPSDNHGVLLFEYKGVQAVLMWMPSKNNSAQEVQSQLMALLTGAQPENTFIVITEGDITVDENEGIFGAFSTQDAKAVVTGGGIIGAWPCAALGVTHALLVTGTDDTTVQIRFKRLLDSFICDMPE